MLRTVVWVSILTLADIGIHATVASDTIKLHHAGMLKNNRHVASGSARRLDEILDTISHGDLDDDGLMRVLHHSDQMQALNQLTREQLSGWPQAGISIANLSAGKLTLVCTSAATASWARMHQTRILQFINDLNLSSLEQHLPIRQVRAIITQNTGVKD